MAGTGVAPQSSGMNCESRALHAFAPARSRAVPNTCGKKSSAYVPHVSHADETSSSAPVASGCRRAAHSAKS